MLWTQLSPQTHRDASGVEVLRLCPGWAFYCETPKATSDGTRFALGSDGFYVCDLETLSVARFDDYVGLLNSSYKDWVYTVHDVPGDGWCFDLYRFGMRSLERGLVASIRGAPRSGPAGHGATISPDGRYMLYQLDVPGGSQLVRLDLTDGAWRTIYEDPWLLRHLQYEPFMGDAILVQQNRGQRMEGLEQRLTIDLPPEQRGATHFILSADGRRKTPLPIGEPHTFRGSGHSSWLGTSHRIACTIDWSHAEGNPIDPPPDWALDPRYPQTSLFTMAPGDAKPTPFLAPEHRFFHVTGSMCGRYFVCNSTPQRKGPVDIVVGSFRTGQYRTVVHDCLCYAGSISPWSVPYLTADLKHVIYRAKVDPSITGDTGWFVFAARLTDEFWGSLE